MSGAPNHGTGSPKMIPLLPFSMSAMTQPSVARRLDRKVLPYGKFCSNPAVGLDPLWLLLSGHRTLIRRARNGGATVIEHLPLTARSLRLQQLDRILERDPEAIEARHERAGLLREQDAFEEAKRDYLELIRRRPTDFGALNDFGNAGSQSRIPGRGAIAVRRGRAASSRQSQRPCQSGKPVAAERRTRGRAGRTSKRRCGSTPAIFTRIAAWAIFWPALGDAAGARRHRDRGFRDHFLTMLPYRGEAPPISVLLLVSAAGGNIPTSSLLDDRLFQTTVLVTEYDDPKRGAAAARLGLQ